MTTDIVWAWIGFAAFTAGTAAFILMGVGSAQKDRHHYVETFFITLVAGMSYLAVALGQGAETSGEIDQFTYARFIDWSITTPLLLLGLATLALARSMRRIELVLGLLAADLFMIGTGTFAGLTADDNPERWIWYVFSAAGQVAVYALIWGPLRKAAGEQREEGERLLRFRDPDERYLGRSHVNETSAFFRQATILSVVWLGYPVNFFLSSQGVNAYGLVTESAVYTVLDVTAKVVYGFLLLGGLRVSQRQSEKTRDETSSPDGRARQAQPANRM